jgi:4-amino-4-deoxy-L-arabinose transferase-like glycosyltransferase
VGKRPWLRVTLLLAALAFATRPLLPPDETRYAAVAWEMWTSGDLLVPTLNGEPYSHKPPLLFWLVVLGWWAFGEVDWWPRLVGPLAMVACMLLTGRLAHRLWPEGSEARRVTMVLLAVLGWCLYGTLLMFDMLLAVGTLVAVLGLVEAARGRQRTGWLLHAGGLAWGLLAKGPVALVVVLSLGLLAPWWAGAVARRRRWWAGWLASFLAAAAAVLAWALPAARAGGPEYGAAILLGQTTSRLVDAADHPAPWWWYLAVGPLLLWRRIGALPLTAER